MTNPRFLAQVVTAGEALMDLIADADGRLRPCDGGSVYNFTRALALQGVASLYLNPLSRDRFGRGLRAGLERAGAHCAEAESVLQPTALAVVNLDDAGKADYAFYRDGVADRHTSAERLNALCAELESLQLACTGCLALSPDDGAVYLPWLKARRAAGQWVVVDANLRPSVFADQQAYCAQVMLSLAQADIVKASDDDLALLGFSVTNPRDAARSLLQQSQALAVALTLGAQGAMLMLRDGRCWQARQTRAVRVADTVGAGDTFLAGLVASLVQGGLAPRSANARWPDSMASAALQHAVASATLCVEKTGCVPPSWAEAQAAASFVQVQATDN